MKRFLLFLLLLLFSGLFIYQWVCRCNDNDCASLFAQKKAAPIADTRPVMPESPLVVKDGKSTILQVSTEDNLKFPKANSEAIVSQRLESNWGRIANYLKTHPNRTLTLVGQYGKEEGNDANLGVSRAEGIKKNLISKGAPADQLLTVAELTKNPIFYQDTLIGGIDFRFKGTPNKPKPAIAKKPVPTPPLVVKDGGETVLRSKENLQFRRSDDKVLLTADTRDGLKKIGDYLKKAEDRELDLVGKYDPKEDNNSKYNDLGKARAEAVKQEMVELGAPADIISTKGKSINNMPFSGDTLKGGIAFNFKVAKKVAENLVNLSRNLYFEIGDAQLNLDAPLRKYFKDVKTYLQQDASKKVLLTGHTDDAGTDEDNIVLGKDRAERVKKELAKMGIAVGRMETVSKGESAPVGSNLTVDGRKANRRVEILIK